MADPPGRYSANRLFEWVSATGMLMTGMTLMLWPRTLPDGNLRPLLHLASVGELAAWYLLLGAIRCVTLTLNGRIGYWGPRIRALMAAICATVWLQMIVALWLQLGQPSMSSGILLALAAGELRSIARARRDLHAA